jgi:type II restriction enzyme
MSEAPIVDGAYKAMHDAILADKTPNLLILHYAPKSWTVRNLLLVPSPFFSLSAVAKRKPLSPSARRPNWVGCNLLLTSIPKTGKLLVVDDGTATPPDEVRSWYNRVTKIAEINPLKRGWTLDVLRIIQGLNKAEFTLQEVYAFEPELAMLHPNNNRIQEKIRQQLQELRKRGMLDFLGKGRYRLL